VLESAFFEVVERLARDPRVAPQIFGRHELHEHVGEEALARRRARLDQH
jgi:uncharacterized protein (DUF2336 family)